MDHTIAFGLVKFLHSMFCFFLLKKKKIRSSFCDSPFLICFGYCVIYIVTLEFTLFYHASDLLDKLRYIPSREALVLRAEAS